MVRSALWNQSGQGFLALVAAITLMALFGCAPAKAPESPAGPVKLSSFDPQVNALLSQMTLAEKVGQMTQADHEFLDPADIEKH
ncbi:MAG: hypothetical protein KIT83_19145, partial [Bryobacterales bacterium]|nr:hypothetical protein [Bryobacterales bacterium]